MIRAKLHVLNDTFVTNYFISKKLVIKHFLFLRLRVKNKLEDQSF